MLEDGTIIDENGNIIGQAGLMSRQLAYDNSGNVMGYVDENGYVKMLFVSGYGSVSSLNVGVGLINHIDAVNN